MPSLVFTFSDYQSVWRLLPLLLLFLPELDVQHNVPANHTELDENDGEASVVAFK